MAGPLNTSSPSAPDAASIGTLPSVSVVIVNYNAAAHVQRCLRSLVSDTDAPPWEAIVVDNASPRPGIERAVAGVPSTTLIRRGRNGGFAVGANTGIRVARAPFVLMLNPDTVVTPGSLRTLVEWIERNPTVGAVGPKVLNQDGSLQYSCRRWPSFQTAIFNRASLATRLFPNNNRSSSYLMSDWDHASVRDVDWLSGSALLLRRAALEQVGLFDSGFFFEIEDVDLCRRLHMAGWRVVYQPAATVIHEGGASSRTAATRVIRARHAGMWRYYRRYHSHGPLLDPLVGAAIAARCAAMLARRVLSL